MQKVSFDTISKNPTLLGLSTVLKDLIDLQKLYSPDMDSVGIFKNSGNVKTILEFLS